MWKKFKSLFISKSKTEPEPVTVEDTADQQHSGDYAVKRSRTFDMLARILAVLAALILWVYVVNTTTTSEQREFSLIPITCKNDAALRAEYGLIVQSMSIDTLNITLMGNKQDIRSLTADQVKVYISLSDINAAGEYLRTVYVDVPSGITLVTQTVNQVLVSVDRPSTEVVPLTPDNLSLRGWSLPDGCYFGKVELNSDHLTLEGPTLALEKVSKIELRSDMIGTADSSFTVTVSPYLLDADGNEITDSSINIREKVVVEASVEVLKSKQVPLSVQGKNGYLTAEQLVISPAMVQIVGDPQTVDATKFISLGTVDEKALLTDESRSFAVTAPSLTITDVEGNSITEATVMFRISDIPVRVIEGVSVWQGERIVGTVSVTVRAASQERAAQLQSLQSTDLVVYADGSKPEGTLSAMSVVFSEFFRGAVYEIGFSGYNTLPAGVEGLIG